MISILIPSYGHEKYIQKTLDSIVEDEFKDKEVIIINDGSPDNSGAIISKWVEENKDSLEITYIDRENKGLNATLNELISLSSGKYIVLLGSDDYLLKGGLKKRYEYLKNNPDKKVVISDVMVVDKDGQKISESLFFDMRGYKKEDFKDDKSLKNTLLKKFSIAGPIDMIDRDIYERIGFYNSNLVAEDLDFYLRAISKDLVGYVDDKVAAYRIHDTNQSITAITPKLLTDSAKAFWINRGLFSLKYQPLIFWNIFKFYVRAFLLYLKS